MYNVHYQPYWLNEDELEHFGIKGMKWGIRRYQNADGTLTEAGKKRYGSKENFEADRERKQIRNAKIKKAAKMAAKIGVTVGLGMLSAKVMDIGISNALNTSATKDQLKMLDDWMIKNGTTTVGGVLVGRSSSVNQGKFSPTQQNLMAQALVNEEWRKYNAWKASR